MDEPLIAECSTCGRIAEADDDAGGPVIRGAGWIISGDHRDFCSRECYNKRTPDARVQTTLTATGTG